MLPPKNSPLTPAARRAYTKAMERLPRPGRLLRSASGFTLLEALITGALAAVVILGMMSLNTYFQNQHRSTQLRSNVQDFHKKVEGIVNQRSTEILLAPPTGAN